MLARSGQSLPQRDYYRCCDRWFWWSTSMAADQSAVSPSMGSASVLRKMMSQ